MIHKSGSHWGITCVLIVRMSCVAGRWSSIIIPAVAYFQLEAWKMTAAVVLRVGWVSTNPEWASSGVRCLKLSHVCVFTSELGTAMGSLGTIYYHHSNCTTSAGSTVTGNWEWPGHPYLQKDSLSRPKRQPIPATVGKDSERWNIIIAGANTGPGMDVDCLACVRISVRTSNILTRSSWFPLIFRENFGIKNTR
jgi:hypothetical protein